jgi:hypothetical protein
MKLILRRAHAVKEKRKDQGIFREPKVENYVEYSLFCTITLSVDEEHALKKYVGDDYAMTYKPGHIREEGASLDSVHHSCSSLARNLNTATTPKPSEQVVGKPDPGSTFLRFARG